MKVKELIKELQEHDPELPVHIYADHGQDYQKSTSLENIYVVELDHEVYSIHEDDLKEYPEAKKAVCIYD